MKNLYEEQSKVVEKTIIALRKEVPIPNSYLSIFKKFLHYVYNIGFNRGYYLERINYNKPIIMKRGRKTIDIFDNVKEASKKTGFSLQQINNNIHGILNSVEGNQFRYTRKKKGDYQNLLF